MGTIKKIGKITIKEHGGHYYLHYTDPFISDPKKRRIRKSYGPTLKYAEARAGAINDRIIRGLAGYPVEDTKIIRDILDEYLELSEINNAERTVVRRRNCYDHWIEYLEQEGVETVDQLTPRIVERYKGWRKGKVKTRTINYELAFLKGAFITVTGDNPFRQVKKLKELDAKRFRPLTKEEYLRVEDCASEDFRPYLIGYVQTGMRKGELLSVAWSDCDFVHDEIVVQNYKGHRDARTATRRVPMTSIVKELLLQRKEEGYLQPWPPPEGKHWLQRYLIRAAFKAGITDVRRIHDLRHTCGSWLTQEGASLPQIKEWLGHEDIESTMIYVTLMPRDLKRVAPMLEPGWCSNLDQ